MLLALKKRGGALMKQDWLVTLLLCLASFLGVNQAAWGNWQLRAREHYDRHQIQIDQLGYRYSGLSNTINFWYEKPYSFSLGLAIGPLLGMALRENNVEKEAFGDRIQLFHAGLEYKFFPWDWLPGFFSRLGVGASYLKSLGSYDELNGRNGYFGIGWEFPLENVGIALELAGRRTYLDQDLEITTLTPSLGFHFYR